MRDLWKRGNPDDIQLLLLTLINAYLAEVPLLQNLRAQVRLRHTWVVNVSLWFSRPLRLLVSCQSLLTEQLSMCRI